MKDIEEILWTFMIPVHGLKVSGKRTSRPFFVMDYFDR